MSRPKRIALFICAGAVLVVAWVLVIPARLTIPVEGAGPHDWHADSFWHAPWGASGVHKGIDIFASAGTPAVAAAGGLVLYSGNIERGGNVVLIVGAQWRLHYYAHLEQRKIATGSLVGKGQRIGSVGDTGNARGKPPHLHYTILSLVPYPCLYNHGIQGWKRMFYLDPGELLTERS